MKKNLTRVLALAMALLMCLSLLPVSALAGDADFAAMIASAQAAQAAAMGGAAPDAPFVMPEQALDYTDPNVCLASEDGQHLWIEVYDPAYICAWGDCTEENPHILYKSCAYCKESAEWLYLAALDEVQAEVSMMSAEEAQALADDPALLADLENRYKQYIFELPDHFYEKQDAQAPTCTAGGHTAYEQCSVCEEIRGYEELDPLGHEWGDYTVTVEPTCTAAGTKVRECLRCGEKEYVDIPALGHDWGEFVTVKEPTCTETGTTKRVCERCGAEDFGEIPAKGHSYGDFTILKEATCTEDGSKEHTCAVCEYKETVVIPAAHTWGDFTVTKEATCTEAGEQEHTCTVCNVTETVAIPAKDHSYGEDGVCTVCGAEKPAESAVVEPTVEEPVVEESKEEESKEEESEKEPAGAQPVGAIVEDCRDMYSSFGAFLAEQNAADAKYVVASYTPVDANGHALGEIPAGGVRFDLPLPEGADAASVQVYTYDYSTYSWSPANFFLSDGSATVSSGAYPYPPFAVLAAPAAAGNGGETTPTKQEASSEETVNEFKDLMDEKGISADDPAGIVAKKVTPLREDGTEMSNEEVAAQGGVTFEMDLPENYEEGDELEFYHKNSETGEWELVTDFEIKGNKVIIHADHFSDYLGFNLTKGGNTALRGSGGEDDLKLITSTGTYISDANTYQFVLLNDTLKVDLPDTELGNYTYKWYREGSDNPLSSGTYEEGKNEYTVVTDNLIGQSIFCVITPTAGGQGRRSNTFKVRNKISFNVEVIGTGKVTVTQTDGVKPSNAQGYQTSYTIPGATQPIQGYNDDTFVFKMTPLANDAYLNEFVVRQINDEEVKVKKGEVEKTPTTASLDGKTYKVLFDVPRNYNEDSPTEASDLAIKNGGKARGLVESLKASEAARLNVDVDDFIDYSDSDYLRYVTPVWVSDALALSDTSPGAIEAMNGYIFKLNYPSNDVKNNKDNYVVFVYHYNGTTWDGPLTDVTLDDDFIIVRYNDFTPFTVLALPKISVTETINGSGTVKRDGTEISSGTYSGASAGTVLNYSVTPASGYATKSVKFNGEEKLNASGEYQFTITTTPNPNTFEVTFVQLEVVEEEASSEVKSSFDTYAAANDLTEAAKKVVKETPKWVGGESLTQDEIEKTGGISIELPYPTDQVKAERANYVIQVFQQNGSTWTEITDSISQTDTGLMLTTTNFAPFAVTAVRKDVTLKFQVGDTAIPALDMPARNGKAVKLPDGSAYSGDKAFKGWNTEPDFTGDSYKAGDSYTPNSGTEPEIKFYAELVTAVTVTFEPGEGVGAVYTQQVPQGVATDLIKNEFTRPEYVFKEWKVKDGTATYKDRGQITTTAPVTLVAQWTAGTAPSAPSDLSLGRSLLNYGNTDLENQAGLISGINSSMEVYAGHGQWNQVTGSTYSVKEPGIIEIRFKSNPTLGTPASESAFVLVPAYFTEASDPVEVEPSTINGKTLTTYKYTVKLYEEYENGTTEEKHETALKEDVMFLLSYPPGLSKGDYQYTLYHESVAAGNEVAIEELTNGIRGSSNAFSDYYLTIEPKLKGTVSLEYYEPQGGKAATSSTPCAGGVIQATVKGSNNEGELSYRWWRYDNDEDTEPVLVQDWKTAENIGDFYEVTAPDLQKKLQCEVKSTNPATGTISSAKSAPVDIVPVEVYNSSEGYIGYFDGVTTGMQYRTEYGNWTDVPGDGTLVENRLYFKEPGTYTFRNKGENDPDFWDGGTIEAWYIIGFTSTNGTSTSTTTGGGTTTTTGTGTTYMYMIPDSSTTGTPVRLSASTTQSYIKHYGTGNTWLVSYNAPARFYIEMKPSSGSYVHYSQNGDPWVSGGASTEGVRVYLGSGRNGNVDRNDYFNVIYNRSSTSPRTADDSHLGLWSALCFMSLAGATVLLNGQRKRRKARR